MTTAKTRLENFIFRFVGVTPYDKKYRDHIDWFYLALWIASVGYQSLLYFCFLFTTNDSIVKFLELMADPYLIAVEGYGIFNIVYHYKQNNRRHRDIKVVNEKRKTRNGHRFILYWWINFIMMLICTNFGFGLDLHDIPGISLKIAVCCSVIGIGYKYAKHKWNHSRC